MIPPLDIFQIQHNNQLIWKASASDLPSAQQRIKLLMASEPGDYLIFSQTTGHKTLITAHSTQNPKSTQNPESTGGLGA